MRFRKGARLNCVKVGLAGFVIHVFSKLLLILCIGFVYSFNQP